LMACPNSCQQLVKSLESALLLRRSEAVEVDLTAITYP